MNAALKNLYLGPLEGFIQPGVGIPPKESETIPASELLCEERLATQLQHFSALYDHGDRRAVASVWSKWHFSLLISSALASNLLLNNDLPLGMEEVHIELAPEGQTRRLWLNHAGRPLNSKNAFTRFSTLIDDHLKPIISALANYSGASPKVFWSNAGNYFEYFTEALQAHPMAIPITVEPARELLASSHLPDGHRNPLFRPVRYLNGANAEVPERRRRLCCIRYLIPELEYCSNCPLNRKKCSQSAGE